MVSVVLEVLEEITLWSKQKRAYCHLMGDTIICSTRWNEA